LDTYCVSEELSGFDIQIMIVKGSRLWADLQFPSGLGARDLGSERLGCRLLTILCPLGQLRSTQAEVFLALGLALAEVFVSLNEAGWVILGAA
jgi:hypothetical protein